MSNKSFRLNTTRFQHYYLLLAAEIQRLHQRSTKAVLTYTKAINAAKRNRDFLFLGIAHECASKHCESQSLFDYAHIHRWQAYQCYEFSAAIANCELLQQHYPLVAFQPLLKPQFLPMYVNEYELDHAIWHHELSLYLQPIFSAKTQRFTHFEALVRWQHPRHGTIAAKDFIPLAEKTGLIMPMGEWVIKSACQQIARWQEQGYQLVPIAINISGLQLKHQAVSTLVKTYLNQYHINPKYLELELTESILVENTDHIHNELNKLKALNVNLSLDDFGTHYANLAYLKHFNFDKIKIDRTFIRDLAHCAQDRSVIYAIIALAHDLHLKVIAEGVEDKVQLNFLCQHGVDELQGYFLGKPEPIAESVKYLHLTHHAS